MHVRLSVIVWMGTQDIMNSFKILKHEKSTRNNGLLVQIPKGHLNSMKNGFFYAGAML